MVYLCTYLFTYLLNIFILTSPINNRKEEEFISCILSSDVIESIIALNILKCPIYYIEIERKRNFIIFFMPILFFFHLIKNS